MLRRSRRSASEAVSPGAALGTLVVFALLLVLAAAPRADASAGAFIKAYGWGVLDGADQFETCAATCQVGFPGGGAGQLYHPAGAATDSAGDVYVADIYNDRIDEFSPAGAFIKAFGWGVLDGADQFEICTTTCQSGILGGGAGQLYAPRGVAIAPSGDVYVADLGNDRIDEFSPAGAFVKGYGWGVLDGANQFETCTTTCQAGIAGAGAGELNEPWGVAIDPSGDVYVADSFNNRIAEFSAAGAFVKGYGWGVLDGANQFETCTTTCQAGIAGAGAGEFNGGPAGIATDSAGNVYVADFNNNRIDEFSPAGAFVKGYGWGVLDGASQFETCTTTCQIGIASYGAGELFEPTSIAIAPSGAVYVAEYGNARIDEFSAAGAFVEAYGWGVLDGADQFETCTTTCHSAIQGGGAGELFLPYGVTTDSSGDVYVTDYIDNRIEEFSPAATTNPVGPSPPVSPPSPSSGGWHAAISHGAGPMGSAPTAGADRAGEQFVFWKGTNGTLWDEWYIHSSWHGPAQITTAGRTLLSSPGVAVPPSGQQDVFWRGPGGNLWETTHTTHWTRRVNLGAGPLGSAPTAGADARGEVFVFWKGTNGALWEKWRTHGRWHRPAKIKIAGRMGSAPGVAVQSSGVQNVFWRGRDGDLWDARHTNRWHRPVNLGAGPLGSAPTAGADAHGDLFVFWEGTDGSLWDRWDLKGAWHGPAKITAAGRMGSAPAVAVHGDGEQDVFWRGTNGALWETWHP
jgi:DNA-binding beta-propeller fold protein YncE